MSRRIVAHRLADRYASSGWPNMARWQPNSASICASPSRSMSACTAAASRSRFADPGARSAGPKAGMQCQGVMAYEPHDPPFPKPVRRAGQGSGKGRPACSEIRRLPRQGPARDRQHRRQLDGAALRWLDRRQRSVDGFGLRAAHRFRHGGPRRIAAGGLHRDADPEGARAEMPGLDGRDLACCKRSACFRARAAISTAANGWPSRSIPTA